MPCKNNVDAKILWYYTSGITLFSRYNSIDGTKTIKCICTIIEGEIFKKSIYFKKILKIRCMSTVVCTVVLCARLSFVVLCVQLSYVYSCLVYTVVFVVLCVQLSYVYSCLVCMVVFCCLACTVVLCIGLSCVYGCLLFSMLSSDVFESN